MRTAFTATTNSSGGSSGITSSITRRGPYSSSYSVCWIRIVLGKELVVWRRQQPLWWWARRINTKLAGHISDSQ